MADRKSFLLRLPPDLLDELNRWARDELRSLNAQIEYVLREAARSRRRTLVDPPPGSAVSPIRGEEEDVPSSDASDAQ